MPQYRVMNTVLRLVHVFLRLICRSWSKNEFAVDVWARTCAFDVCYTWCCVEKKKMRRFSCSFIYPRSCPMVFVWAILIDYGCADGRFPVSSSCVTVQSPDLLFSSGTWVNPGLRSWKNHSWLSLMSESRRWNHILQRSQEQILKNLV
jgi:hypothetical protein